MRYPTLKDAVTFTRAQLNHSISKKAGSFDLTNSAGIYHIKFQIACPYDNKKRSISFYYYRSEDGQCPVVPVAAYQCVDEYAKSNKIKNNLQRLSSEEQESLRSNVISDAVANQIEQKMLRPRLTMITIQLAQ